jgi:hypothetical protein
VKKWACHVIDAKRRALKGFPTSKRLVHERSPHEFLFRTWRGVGPHITDKRPDIGEPIFDSGSDAYEGRWQSLGAAAADDGNAHAKQGGQGMFVDQA